ncbi:MAG: hypothetical protein ACI8XX_001135 [Polaribacter sp.]|jgi:hypothetical protein
MATELHGNLYRIRVQALLTQPLARLNVIDGKLFEKLVLREIYRILSTADLCKPKQTFKTNARSE